MEELLKKFREQRRLVSIYSKNTSHERFCFGRILAVNDKHLVVSCISPYGAYDGISLHETTGIFQMITDGQYSRKMLRLMPQDEEAGWKPALQEDDLLRSFLIAAKQEKKLVNIELLDSNECDMIGFVDAIEENVICVRQIDDYGMEDGRNYARLEDITWISCDAEEERRLEMLMCERH